MAIYVGLIVLLVTWLVAGCGDEIPSVEPPAGEEPTRPTPTATERSASARQDEPVPAPEQRAQSQTAGQHLQPAPPQSGSQDGAVQEAPATGKDTKPAEDDSTTTAAVRRVGAPRTPAELTDVPASIRDQADVRLRPGLAWPIVDRLLDGDSVSVLDRAGTWFRVRARNGRTGWIRDGTLDLGEVEGSDIRRRSAPIIVAEWQGAQFSVMGQSADQTRVVLVAWDQEAGVIFNAPIDDVALIDADFPVHDLPIFIGGETVVYRGDDFGPGQGRLLPEANEWMWLPWGWLLAQNDEQIWLWRPEQDEVEFAPRPAGLAKFSPDGQFLAIVPGLTTQNPDCSAADDIVILPLDGSPALSLREQLRNSGDAPRLDFVCAFGADNIRWRSDSRALIVEVSLQPQSTRMSSSAVLEVTGRAGLFHSDVVPEEQQSCWLWHKWGPDWWFSGDDAVATTAGCTNSDGNMEWIRVLFDLTGAFLRLEPESVDPSVSVGKHNSDLLRGAEQFDEIGDDFRLLWSPLGGQAVVIALAEPAIWVYDTSANRLRRINIDAGVLTPDTFKYLHVPHDIFWLGDSSVAIIPKHGYDETTAVILIDIASGIATEVDHGGIRGWPCLPSGSWSPDGEYFQVGFATQAHRVDFAGRHWIDGTAIMRSHIRQRLITRADGSEVVALRTTGERRYAAPPHRAEWSPNGNWLAIGGQNRSSQCWFGP